MDKCITVGSVCSGIEAASVAWVPLGFKFNWFSEIAPFPSSFLHEKYPDIPNLGDMSVIADGIRGGSVETCDVICAGTPCQAFSLAGWQNGLNDDRGNLTLKFVDIVNANDEVRLSSGKGRCIAFWENVEGVLTDKTNAFGCLISSLAGLSEVLTVKGGRWPSAGFLRGKDRVVVWRVLDAKYFGLPQQRRRLYVIAGDESVHPENILFEHTEGGETPEYDLSKDSYTFSKDGSDFTVFRAYTDCLYSSYATKWNGNAAAYNGSLFVVQDGRIRRLSPIECERLMGFPDNYTNIKGARKSNRYNSVGNSWAVPVVKWLGERIKTLSYKDASDWFPIQSTNDFEYHELSKGSFVLKSEMMNSSEKPTHVALGDMRDIVCTDAQEDIYLSPVGCAGILRRTKERSVGINKTLKDVLSICASKMPDDEIEKRSRVQKRGRLSN